LRDYRRKAKENARRQRDREGKRRTQESEPTSVGVHKIETRNEEDEMEKGITRKEEQYRNTTTVRWTDAQMRAVCDTAWSRRTSVSKMVREMVTDKLKKEGVEI
jgi:hypothetical protein